MVSVALSVRVHHGEARHAKRVEDEALQPLGAGDGGGWFVCVSMVRMKIYTDFLMLFRVCKDHI